MATTEIYTAGPTLSLHDALPLCRQRPATIQRAYPQDHDDDRPQRAGAEQQTVAALKPERRVRSRFPCGHRHGVARAPFRHRPRITTCHATAIAPAMNT